MNFIIKNPIKDQYGNSKDNIFLAFDNKDNYLGSAYAYKAINYHQTYETPCTIFIDVNVEGDVDNLLYEEVRQRLFDEVYLRAKTLRMENPNLKAKIYSGFEYNKNKLDFYLKNGFNEDYSIVMETSIKEDYDYSLPKSISVIDLNLESEKDIAEYKKTYDEIFVTPLDINLLKEQSSYNNFKNLYFVIDGKIQGGCTIFEKDGFGYIETIYVLPEARGKGLSKQIVGYIFQYFVSLGLNKTKLEVWQSVKRAVELYKSFGYTEIGKNLMFPYIIL